MSDGTIVDSGNQKPRATGSEKNGSWVILNLLLIIMGILFFSKGILDFLTWIKVFQLPKWLSSINDKLSGDQAKEALSIFGNQAIISATLGFWALIAGILLFKNAKIGWGMALVILSTMALMGISQIISWISNPATFNIAYWPNYITILSVLIGTVGFFWLLMTGKNYT